MQTPTELSISFGKFLRIDFLLIENFHLQGGVNDFETSHFMVPKISQPMESSLSLTKLMDKYGLFEITHATSSENHSINNWDSLAEGTTYKGIQRCGTRDYQVKVELKKVNTEDSFLCGFLSIYNLTEVKKRS